ncbi:MAG: acyltransferase [Flavobacteriales bacterium]|nr:acyltransferase [Flavobacteriales bacterium]
MSMVQRIIESIRYRLCKWVKPEMIGFKHWNGAETPGLRISNMTHLSFPKHISFGKNTFIGHFNYIDGYKRVAIGEGVQITNHVSILTHSSHHALRLLGERYGTNSEHPVVRTGEVKIGDYTFVGANAVIMPGTTIGKGCIISAYTYVEGNVPDYTIMRGIPGIEQGKTTEIDTRLLSIYPELKSSYYLTGNEHI